MISLRIRLYRLLLHQFPRGLPKQLGDEFVQRTCPANYLGRLHVIWKTFVRDSLQSQDTEPQLPVPIANLERNPKRRNRPHRNHTEHMATEINSLLDAL